jgi:outer membrane protein assembly factor BamB
VEPPARVLPESIVIWRDSQAISSARPTFDAHAAYFLGTHMVYAVDKSTGGLLWSTALTYPGLSTGILQGYGTAVAAGLVIMGDIDVFGLDPQTGVIRWRFAPRLQYPNEREFQRLATDGSTVYVGGVWGNVYGVDAATGTQRWISHVTALPDSFVRVFNPVVDHGVVYVAFADDTHAPTDGGVAAFDAATGARLWSTVLPRHHTGAQWSTEATTVALTPDAAITATAEGYVYRLNRNSGIIVDTVPSATLGFTAADSTLESSFSIAAMDSIVVVGVQSTSKLLALDATNLQHVLWTSGLNEGSPDDIVLDSSRVYSTYAGGPFAVSDLRTGKAIWWVGSQELRPYVEEILFGPAVDTDRIYVGADRDVYAFPRR